MEVKVKRIGKHNLPLPEYKTSGSAGMDLCANMPGCRWVLSPGERVTVGCGFAFAIPDGYELQVRGRSGHAKSHGIEVIGSRTIDSDYRGEVGVILINLGDTAFEFEDGDRIAQGVIAPVVRATLTEVEELTATERGANGFGHTGTK